ncbi:MAG: ABC transporter permease subunit [Clostridia bacterium]|nr:ABC transporter permease subunit [Clostridia bacterium]
MELLKFDDFLERDENGAYYVPKEQQVRDEVEKNRWKVIGKTVLTDWRLYLMLVPMILVYILWKYLPMYELTGCFRNPGTDIQHVNNQWWVGFHYFINLLGADKGVSAPFWNAFRNTFITAFYGLLFGFPVPIILAIFFNEVRSNIARSIMQVCVYLPKFLSTVIVTTLAIMLFRQEVEISGGGMQEIGLLSRVFLVFGAKEEVVKAGLINSSQFYRPIYIITDLWEHAGYDSIVFFAAVIAVSPTSYEAAQIDGAGKMAQMRYVVLPSILSTVVIMLIMKIGSLLSVGYEKIYLLLDNKNYEVAQVVSTLSNMWSGPDKEGGIANGSAYGMAAEMLNNLIGMILVIGANSIARKASDVSLY